MTDKINYDLVVFDWEGTLKMPNTLNTTLIPGALCVLKALKAKSILIGIATGSSTQALKQDLDALDLSQFFDAWRTAEQTWTKPNPQMLEEILDECGVSPEKTLMVGDNACDMEMAIAAKCDCLGVDFQRRAKQSLLDAGAMVIINDYTDFFTSLSKG